MIKGGLGNVFITHERGLRSFYRALKDTSRKEESLYRTTLEQRSYGADGSKVLTIICCNLLDGAIADGRSKISANGYRRGGETNRVG